MVYGFVKQSGGHVKIYSELGQGTTVKLYFPRTAMTAASPDRIDAALPIRSGKETVLLVEDDPSVRLAVRRSLDAFGYAVHSVGTGEDALQLVRDGLTPDLLLADVVLPGGMSGREVSDAIALLAPSCRTLYMSGYTDNAIVHHGRLDVGVTLISKPFTRQTLAAKIREVLDAD
jgi:CheY-like chemotaxis protein